MTFGNFIKTLNSAKVFGCVRDDIAANLLCVAGINISLDQNLKSTVSKWIDRKVPDNITAYFPYGKVNEAGTLRFFKLWINSTCKIERVQKQFVERNKVDNCIVDCSTKEPEVFFQSLLVQFVDSLGLPLPQDLDFEMNPCPYCAGIGTINNCPYCGGTGIISRDTRMEQRQNQRDESGKT